MIENKANIHATIMKNEFNVNSNLHQTKVIAPIARLTSADNQEVPNLVFVNTTGKTIFGFRIIEDGNNILMKQRLYNKETITIPIFHDNHSNMIISYSFYKNKQINTIFMSLTRAMESM